MFSSINLFGRSLKYRSIFFLLIFCLEIIGVSVNFDGEFLAVSASPLLGLIGKSHELIKSGMAIIGFFIILALPKAQSFISILKKYDCRPGWHYWLCLHFVNIALFVYLTSYLFAGVNTDTTSILIINIAALGWIITGLGCFVFLINAIAPLACWLQLIRQVPLLIFISVLVGILSWYFGELAEFSWQPLAEYTFYLCHQLLALIYSDINYNLSDRILGTTNFRVQISPECSGYEGIGLIVVFFSVYLWLFRNSLRFPRVLLLFPIGILAIWLLNSVRIVSLIVIGSSFSAEVAAGGFHSNAGWFVFIISAVGLVLLSQRIDYFNVDSVVKYKATPVVTEVTALIIPFIVLLSIILLTTTFSVGFDWFYPVRVIIIAILLWSFRERYKLIFKDITVSSVLIGVGVFMVWLLMVEVSTENNKVFFTELFDASPVIIASWLSFRFIGAAVTVPIVEELIFRGYLLKKLVQHDFINLKPIHFTWFSFLFSSILFGLLHGEWIAGTIAGMGFAYALYQRGEVSDAIVAHMTTNTLLAIYVLSTGNWSLW